MFLCGKDNKPFSIDNEIKKKVHGAKSEKAKKKDHEVSRPFSY